MTKNSYLDIFDENGIKPTAIRLLILKTMYSFDSAFSLMDLEERLETVDKSTIFRTITLFHEHHLIHNIEDGSGSTKYCLCHNQGECTPEEFHCHFYCDSCKRTFCLENTPIPIIKAEDGFVVKQINYLLKGTCIECNQKN